MCISNYKTYYNILKSGNTKVGRRFKPSIKEWFKYKYNTSEFIYLFERSNDLAKQVHMH